MRNDIIHQKGEATVASSVSFPQAYRHDSSNVLPLGNDKGKMPIFLSPPNRNTPETSSPGTWTAPEPGWIKLNVDGSFVSKEIAGGAGVVARDSVGDVHVCSLPPSRWLWRRRGSGGTCCSVGHRKIDLLWYLYSNAIIICMHKFRGSPCISTVTIALVLLVSILCEL